MLDRTLSVAKRVIKGHPGIAGKAKHMLDAGSGENFDERSRPFASSASSPTFAVRTIPRPHTDVDVIDVGAGRACLDIATRNLEDAQTVV